MKRFILPLILLLLVGTAFAVESEPSAVVGYFKLQSAPGDYTPLSLPFNYADLSVQSVIGDQFADGDEIADIQSGINTGYYDGFGWFGDLEELDYGKVYWTIKHEDNPFAEFYVLGTVDPSPVVLNIYGNGFTPWSLNEAREVALQDLFEGFAIDGDEIANIMTGENSVYYDGFGWFGDLEYVEPTQGYWYVTEGDGFSWTYNPDLPRTANSSVLKSSRK